MSKKITDMYTVDDFVNFYKITGRKPQKFSFGDVRPDGFGKCCPLGVAIVARKTHSPHLTVEEMVGFTAYDGGDDQEFWRFIHGVDNSGCTDDQIPFLVREEIGTEAFEFGRKVWEAVKDL